MLSRNQLPRNGVFSACEVIVTGVCFFLLYRVVIDAIGIEAIGIWGLLTAILVLPTIADPIVGSGITTLVAREESTRWQGAVAEIIETAAISKAAITGLLLAASYHGVALILERLTEDHVAARELVLLVGVSLWVGAVASVPLAGLEGRQRVDLRSAVLMLGAILNLVVAAILVPDHGIVGLGQARMVQSLFVLVTAWLVLRGVLTSAPLLPRRWSRKYLRALAAYGFRYLSASSAMALIDPVTKALMAKFGSVELVGYYELASKLVLQVRALLVSLSRVLVPAVADLQRREIAAVVDLYQKSCRVNAYLAVPAFGLLVVTAAPIGEIWIGREESFFELATFVLCLGWLTNTLATPAYFANLGLAQLGWNTYGHFAMLALLVLFGYPMGALLGGTGVAIAVGFAIASGSVAIVLGFGVVNHTQTRDIAPREGYILYGFTVLAMLGSLALFKELRVHVGLPGATLTSSMAYAIAVSIPAWRHPLRRRLIEYLRRGGA